MTALLIAIVVLVTIIAAFFFMRERRFVRAVVEDFDAELSPVSGATGHIKIEHKRYRDGDIQIQVWPGDTGAFEGQTVTLRFESRTICEFELRRHKRFTISQREGDLILNVKAGMPVSLESGGKPIFGGKFMPD